MILKNGLLAGVLLLLAAAPVVAGDEGRALAHACTSCHGIEGRGGAALPAISGRPASELLALMRDLRSSDTTMDASATIMPRLLRGYDDAQLQALAAYFAQVSP